MVIFALIVLRCPCANTLKDCLGRCLRIMMDTDRSGVVNDLLLDVSWIGSHARGSKTMWSKTRLVKEISTMKNQHGIRKRRRLTRN